MSLKLSKAEAKRLLGIAEDEGGTVVSHPAEFREFVASLARLPDPIRGPDAYSAYSVLIEDWHPTTLNRLLNVHHFEAGKRKRRDAEVIFNALSLHGVPNATKHKVKREVTLELTFMHGQRMPDPDAWSKSTLDGLVRCGALVNDSHHWVTEHPVRYIRADRIATRIILKDCEPTKRTK